MIILSLKLPPEIDTKASNFTSLRMVLPKNCKTAMYLIASLESSLGGFFRKRIVHIDFTFNRSYSAIV